MTDISDLFFVIYVISSITHPAQFWMTGLMGCSSGCIISLWTANKPPITMSPGELAPTRSSVFWQEKAISVPITKQGIKNLTNAMFLFHLLSTSFKSIKLTAGPTRAPMSPINKTAKEKGCTRKLATPREVLVCASLAEAILLKVVKQCCHIECEVAGNVWT